MLYRRELPKEEVKSAAEYILSEGMRLESLSLKLMDLFVLDKQDFLLERMSVKEMFENLAQGIEPVCRKYGAALHMEIGEGMIRVDYDLFKTMILNPSLSISSFAPCTSAIFDTRAIPIPAPCCFLEGSF